MWRDPEKCGVMEVREPQERKGNQQYHRGKSGSMGGGTVTWQMLIHWYP